MRRWSAVGGRLPLLVAALVFAAYVGAPERSAVTVTPAVPCPPGTQREAEQPVAPHADTRWRPEYQGGVEVEYEAVFGDCVPTRRAEMFAELVKRESESAIVRTAPFDTAARGALRAAIGQRMKLAQADARVPGNRGRARPYGVGPVHFDDPRYDDGHGLVDATARIDDLHHDEATGLTFAAVSTGGVWMSKNQGGSWRPIGDGLPTTAVSAVSYTRKGGPRGTVLVLTGEHTFGFGAFLGLGAWYSRDLGTTWHQASGVPDGALAFALAVDPSRPRVVYAATGRGLRRSTDAGRTYTDVALPTGRCAGRYGIRRCNLANFVTDVVVQTPGGTAHSPGGAVVAAVGWRGGRHKNPDGTVQSPANGIYRSETGQPGTFQRLPGLGGAAGGRERLGRIELGAAYGPAQDHRYLYAVVQDAILLHGGESRSTVPSVYPLAVEPPTVLNGVYVSDDFGASWTLLADDRELADACAAHRSVYCIYGVVEPGIQSWYNLWIQPDPTMAVGGVPSRVLFGLEEVWQSRNTQMPQNTPATTFEVVGSYYGSVDCLLAGVDCAVNRVAQIKTVHPDQHAAVMIPSTGADGSPDGGVTLLAGHDGGLSSQTATQADDFDQGSWRLEQENGLQTALPYSAVWANDGVAYAGLQDNGRIRVDPADGHRQYEIYGADGTFAAVDPANSDYAWGATQNGHMGVTTDGGKSWVETYPGDPNFRFVNPFVMDPLDANHVLTGGRFIWETIAGPRTGDDVSNWRQVFDLGAAPGLEEAPSPDQPAAPHFGMSAIDTRGPVTYAGFCGVCDILNTPFAFRSGLATNVGTDVLPEAGTSKGWHIARSKGLPNRYITSVAIDPQDPALETIYVTLGGYSRRWVPPGTNGEHNAQLGAGHLFKSTDAGETFQNISGNLPDVPALWVEPRGGQLLVGTDLGAFISRDSRNGVWAALGRLGELPATPVTSIQLKPDDPDVALLALYGRGLWTYTFSSDAPDVPAPPAPAPVVGRPVPPTGPTPKGVVLAGPVAWETGDEGWTVETTGNPLTSWARQSPGHNSQTNFGVAAYMDAASTTLTSPPLHSPGGRVFVSWASKHKIEGAPYDQYRLEFSRDGDAWAPVAVVGGENAAYPAFSPQSVTFHTDPGSFYLRFNFFSDEICSSVHAPGVCTGDQHDGAYIDGVTVLQ